MSERGKRAIQPPPELAVDLGLYKERLGELMQMHRPVAMVKQQSTKHEVETEVNPDMPLEITQPYTHDALLDTAVHETQQIMPLLYRVILPRDLADSNVALHLPLRNALRSPVMSGQFFMSIYDHIADPIYKLTTWQSRAGNLMVDRTTVAAEQPDGRPFSWALMSVANDTKSYFFEYDRILPDGRVFVPSYRLEQPLTPLEECPSEFHEALICLNGLVEAENRHRAAGSSVS